jgi:hypothetical protein
VRDPEHAARNGALPQAWRLFRAVPHAGGDFLIDRPTRNVKRHD